MTLTQLNGAHAPTRPLIDDVIAQYGAMRVLLSAARALLRFNGHRRARPPDISQLDARMRRDVGLLPEIDLPEWRIKY